MRGFSAPPVIDPRAKPRTREPRTRGHATTTGAGGWRHAACVVWLIVIAFVVLAPALSRGGSFGSYDLLGQLGLLKVGAVWLVVLTLVRVAVAPAEQCPTPTVMLGLSTVPSAVRQGPSLKPVPPCRGKLLIIGGTDFSLCFWPLLSLFRSVLNSNPLHALASGSQILTNINSNKGAVCHWIKEER